MNAATKLSQEDVDTLFQVDFPMHESIATDLAARLLVLGYLASIEPAYALQASTTADVDGQPVYLRLTESGRLFLAKIRDRLEGPTSPPLKNRLLG